MRRILWLANMVSRHLKSPHNTNLDYSWSQMQTQQCRLLDGAAGSSAQGFILHDLTPAAQFGTIAGTIAFRCSVQVPGLVYT